MTYTTAKLEVSRKTYEEIRKLLWDAGYFHSLQTKGEIDMHGIALTRRSSHTRDCDSRKVPPEMHHGVPLTEEESCSCGFIEEQQDTAYAASPKTDPAPAVHILLHGVPLCGCFPGTLPGNWPPGHKWVGLVTDREKANCEKCIAVAKNICCRAIQGFPNSGIDCPDCPGA